MKNKAPLLLILPGAALIIVSLVIFWMQDAEDQAAREASLELMKSWALSSDSQTHSEETSQPASPTWVLSIPQLGLELPILEECTEEGLKQAPCLYDGSDVCAPGLVIAGHSYDSHFGKLSHLKTGAQVTITDRTGNTFSYIVESQEFIPGDSPDKLNGEAYDLTLFTCTYDGSDRLLVRCTKTPVEYGKF